LQILGPLRASGAVRRPDKPPRHKYEAYLFKLETQ
jgi:hypothetical protein